MDMNIKSKFLKSWEAHFGNADLPIAFYHTDLEDGIERVPPPAAHMSML